MPRKITWIPVSRRGAACLGCALVVGILSLARPAPAAPAVAVPFRQDRVLIIPKAGHNAALANQHAAERVKVRKKFSRLGNIHVLELPNGADPQALIERYRRNGHVETADLDYMGWRPAATPNDPDYMSKQWHLNNTGQLIASIFGAPDADIDAPEAWDILNSASNIIVAVLDTGVRLTHEDLAANLWTNPGESGGGKETNGIDDDGNGYTNDVHGINVLTGSGDPTDDYGHGTHVAGIIGAVGNNGAGNNAKGVCGVAWKVQIMPLKFFSPGVPPPSDSQVMECLDYAINKKARVINFSFVTRTTTPTLWMGFQGAQSEDIVLCAAAGNNGTDNNMTPYYPASYGMNNIVAVAATDNSDGLWPSSNYGSTSVHLAAPGVEIYSTFFSTDYDYRSISGTSMAAPMVSGAAALLRARFTNDTAPQIIRRLLHSVDVLPGFASHCISGGRLNLRKALDTATMPLFTVTNASYDWVPTNGMTPIIFTLPDGNNGPLPLPFAFPFYGRSYTQIWVGINGLLGLTNTGLMMGTNTNIPGIATPNAIYPYWDDLTTNATGRVCWGVVGVAPNRKAVVTWSAVAHMTAGGGPFTFQAVLHESGQVAFQYQQVSLGATAFANGKSATIGIEELSGLFGTKYSFQGTNSLGATALVSNNQALLFTPQGVGHPAPGLRLETGLAAGQSQLTLSGEPAQPGAILCSTNLVSWSMVYSNLLPASGLVTYSHTNSSSQTFFRAISGPFLP